MKLLFVLYWVSLFVCFFPGPLVVRCVAVILNFTAIIGIFYTDGKELTEVWRERAAVEKALKRMRNKRF